MGSHREFSVPLFIERTKYISNEMCLSGSRSEVNLFLALKLHLSFSRGLLFE